MKKDKIKQLEKAVKKQQKQINRLKKKLNQTKWLPIYLLRNS